MTVKEWLTHAAQQLTKVGIASARLDAELLLAHTLRKPRTWLHAHDTEALTDRQIEIADARLDLRRDRVPVAYIIGHKEFYGRRFKVTTATLIPRPETEDLIHLVAQVMPKNQPLLASPPLRIVDVGTGSGILGITTKREYPECTVDLVDVSRHALQVAEENARALEADVELYQSDLLAKYPYTADVIIANLPYVDQEWERSPETDHEPSLALFATQEGRALIYKLLGYTPSSLASGGYLILEADPVQHADIIKKAHEYQLVHIETHGYGILLQKVA